MTDENRQNGDFTRGLARPARQMARRRQRGAGDADARPRIDEAQAPGAAREAFGRPASRGRRGRPEQRRETLVHVGGVVPAQGFVGDRRDEFAQAPLQAGAPFGRVEAPALGFPLEQHFRQRLGAAQDLADRLRAARARDVVRVLALGQHGEAQALAGADQRQRRVDGAERRLVARLVAVEAEDRLARHAPQQRALVGRQRGAERRDGLGEAAWVIAIASTYPSTTMTSSRSWAYLRAR